MASGNPFIEAWCDADGIGKMIFIGLITLSIISWTLIGYKFWVMKSVKDQSLQFKRSFYEQKESSLNVNYTAKARSEAPNAFFLIYDGTKNKAIELLEKNNKIGLFDGTSKLCAADIPPLESHADSLIQSITKFLEKNIFILSTTVTLAPFLGLLGTVYGILLTFSSFSAEGSLLSNQQILGGLSLALTTTVLGLINAIPALIGYNMLRTHILEFDNEMEHFATEILSCIDVQYRR
jgi:biopolymer transport protein TolQ